jgi:ribosomal protein S18 acetylase RimI-like enzyme
MPVFVARDASGIRGAAMGYATAHPPWPNDLAEEWTRFESAIPGLAERMAIYDEISARGKPPAPHYYLGVIGVDPDLHGRGVGTHCSGLSVSFPQRPAVFRRVPGDGGGIERRVL